MQKKKIQANKEEIRTKKGEKSRACNKSSMIKTERSKLSPKGRSKGKLHRKVKNKRGNSKWLPRKLPSDAATQESRRTNERQRADERNRKRESKGRSYEMKKKNRF